MGATESGAFALGRQAGIELEPGSSLCVTTSCAILWREGVGCERRS
jgi:hypothetical protein